MSEWIKIEVDASTCRDCEACMLACSLLHEGHSNPSLSRVVVRKDMASYTFSILLCEQCQEQGEHPACLLACPSEAIYIDPQGAVIIDDDLCLQCGECAEACPFGAIFYNPEVCRYYKCDLCIGVARSPVCVEICPVDALVLRLHDPAEGDR